MGTLFNNIDVLVLSVIYKNNQIELVKWIGMIDCYERIILTLNELNDSLEKLQKSGLIQLSSNQFLLSSEAIKLFPKKFNIRNYEKIHDKLSKKEYIEMAECNFKVTEEEYSKALKQYYKIVAKSLNN
ncbi:MAG: hypothetical protein IJW49_10880 [Clostridia bacterium]|nr:hypothetical protein [Clostridia bacterium]